MKTVVEIGVVGEIVNSGPPDRRAGFVALAQGIELVVLLPHQIVTVHADLCGRYRCHRCSLDRRVAIATIDGKVSGVNPVAIRNGLFRTVADVCV